MSWSTVLWWLEKEKEWVDVVIQQQDSIESDETLVTKRLSAIGARNEGQCYTATQAELLLSMATEKPLPGVSVEVAYTDGIYTIRWCEHSVL